MLCVRFSTDGELLLAGCSDDSIHVYNTTTGELVTNLRESYASDAITCIKFRPEARYTPQNGKLYFSTV